MFLCAWCALRSMNCLIRQYPHLPTQKVEQGTSIPFATEHVVLHCRWSGMVQYLTAGDFTVEITMSSDSEKKEMTESKVLKQGTKGNAESVSSPKKSRKGELNQARGATGISTKKALKAERRPSTKATSKAEKLVCRYCRSDDLSPSFVKRRDARCRACFKKRYGSSARSGKAKTGKPTKASK